MSRLSVTQFSNILRTLSSVLIISFLLNGCNQPNHGKVRIATEMNIGESQVIKLNRSETVNLKLLDIKEMRDSLRNAVRAAYVKLSVDGEVITLVSGNYNLPVSVGKIQIDCPVTKGYYSNNNMDFWRLHKDAAFRIWEKDAPYLEPGTFVFPVGQRWFASLSQSSNEPTYVDGGENPAGKSIYYHAPVDFGGSEGMDEIFSATDGLVISAKGQVLAGNENLGLRRQDAKDGVYILDNRNWYVRYSHLDSILSGIKPGARVSKGQKIGYMGKQGSSGGWVHLHFAIFVKDSLSGEWKVEDAYPYLWESYVNRYKPPLIAVARPHQLLLTDQETTLDGTKSRSFKGEILKYEWTFCDGTKAAGPVQKKSYSNPGEYSEILKVTDSKGNIDYDFTVIQVYNRYNPDHTIPAMQASYHPSLNIHPGDPVTFLVRTFNTASGNELWDFGDGSPGVAVRSQTVDRKNPVKGKFAETIHAYSKAGHYIVSVERTDEAGIKAISHLHVVVEE